MILPLAYDQPEARFQGNRPMLLVDDLGRLGNVEIEGAIGRFQDGSGLEAVGMAGGLARHNHVALPGVQIDCWQGVLPQEKEVALTIVQGHKNSNPFFLGAPSVPEVTSGWSRHTAILSRPRGRHKQGARSLDTAA
ncbi:MAG: hypothetical protein JO215_10805 [Ktedonobacteraceae bacterium]|nr:hypothetical protein [Ktedonobacteraceae bacterium]